MLVVVIQISPQILDFRTLTIVWPDSRGEHSPENVKAYLKELDVKVHSIISIQMLNVYESR